LFVSKIPPDTEQLVSVKLFYLQNKACFIFSMPIVHPVRIHDDPPLFPLIKLSELFANQDYWFVLIDV